MKNIPIQLLEHYRSGALTVATLWKITRTDGVIVAWNDVDIDLEYDGVLYKAGKGITPTAIAGTEGGSVDNLEVESLLGLPDEAGAITLQDMRDGLYDGARIDLYRVNYNDLSMGAEIMPTGFFGEFTASDIGYTAELRGLKQREQTQVGRIFQPSCDADLGDARCGVDLEALRVYGSITSGVTFGTFIDTSLTQPDNYFGNGLLEFLTGDNAGQKIEVMAYDSTTKEVVLYDAPKRPMKVGDTYTMTPGCDKSIDTCREKYENQVRFRGFPFIPGADQLVSGKRETDE